MYFRKLFLKSDGTLYQEGDKMYRPELANTLETIVKDPVSFYSGSLANDVLQDLQEIGINFYVFFSMTYQHEACRHQHTNNMLTTY